MFGAEIVLSFLILVRWNHFRVNVQLLGPFFLLESPRFSLIASDPSKKAPNTAEGEESDFLLANVETEKAHHQHLYTPGADKPDEELHTHSDMPWCRMHFCV